MATKQRKIPPAVKRELIKETGGNCANPGCPHGGRLEFHHIRHWAVYKAHDSEHMIVLCPTCHDAAHFGALQISDEDLYRWKSLHQQRERVAQVFVPPAARIRMLAGSLAFETTSDRVTILQFPDGANAGFRILDEDLLQVNARLHTVSGEVMLRVVENVVRVSPDPDVHFEQRPGRFLATAPVSSKYIPGWVVGLMDERFPEIFQGGRYKVLEVEVLEPGLVQLSGCWATPNRAVVVHAGGITACDGALPRSQTIFGEGLGSVIRWAGLPRTAIFNQPGFPASAAMRG